MTLSSWTNCPALAPLASDVLFRLCCRFLYHQQNKNKCDIVLPYDLCHTFPKHQKVWYYTAPSFFNLFFSDCQTDALIDCGTNAKYHTKLWQWFMIYLFVAWPTHVSRILFITHWSYHLSRYRGSRVFFFIILVLIFF